MGYQNDERPDELPYLVADINYDLTDLIRDVEVLLPNVLDERYEPMKRIIKNIKFIKDSVWILDRKLFPVEKEGED